jgi:hypothetical protein
MSCPRSRSAATIREIVGIETPDFFRKGGSRVFAGPDQPKHSFQPFVDREGMFVTHAKCSVFGTFGLSGADRLVKEGVQVRCRRRERSGRGGASVAASRGGGGRGGGRGGGGRGGDGGGVVE